MFDSDIPQFLSSRLSLLILSFFRFYLFFFDLGGVVTFFHSCLSLFLYLQYGKTPLHWACGKGDEKIVEMLVTAGADVRVKAKTSDLQASKG